ncbi:hypothetical protein PYW07_006439 [Mythimna separata]|uniref:MD-2-related lipid-recognition domain-containing protein n=1 Tax=Mythimna separata TaxID=271217 RepID=A0AAD7YUV5_MYTSE|nr:hypothetical protein PYW07_006439 [Mythimna separata]
MKFVLQTSDMAGASVVFSVLLLCVVVSMEKAAFFGIGVWEVMGISKCEEDSHLFKYDITLTKKINDSHDLYKGHIVLNEDFSRDYGVRLEICKIEDGKCAQSQTIEDYCFIDFFESYAKQSVGDCIRSIQNLDSPTLPIPKGEYDIEHTVYSHEPGVSMFGEYNITVLVMKEDKAVGCIASQIEFKEIE